MDATMLVIEAQDARGRMQDAKRQIKAEVRRKYEAQMKQEIADRAADAEAEFARVLARVHAAGVSQAVLRREVLRTNVWSTWTYWRDLAEIEPERVSIAAAKKKAARTNGPFRWSDDYATLTVVKDSKGRDIEPVVFPMSKNRWVASVGRWWPTTGTEYENGLSQPERAARKADAQFSQMVSDEIQARIDAGEVPEP